MDKCLLFIFIFMCSFFTIIKAEDIFSAFDNFEEADKESKDDQTKL